MNLIKDFHEQTVEILDFQTTYLVVQLNNVSSRFDFKNKKEAFLKYKTKGTFRYYTHHPLLINHNESSHEVFINSKPEDAETFIADLRTSFHEITEGWRNFEDYIESKSEIFDSVFNKNISKGSGKILTVPLSLLAETERICQKHHIKMTAFGGKKITQNELIMIDQQFIIAEQFIPHSM